MKHYIESLKQIFATAPNKHQANYLSQAVLEEMSCDPEFFTSVLEKHLQTAGSLNTNPYVTLREVWRVLKPGGVFYFDAPNEDALYTRIGNIYQRLLGRDWVVNLAPTFAPYHVQGFNRKSVQRLLDRVGFEVDSLTIFGRISPMTGKTSIRKRIEHRAGQLVNWLGNQSGTGIYMYVWAKKPASTSQLV